MKVGRNDPCPCGSGKKYKQCCLINAVESADDGLELRWQRQKRVTDGLTADLLTFAVNEFGREALNEAWTEFTLGEEEVFDAETRHMQVFMPWFFYDWMPEAVERGGHTAAAERATVTGAYLRKRGRHLDPVLRDYLEACIDAQFSFHEVLRVNPGHGFRLRDILTGGETEIIEKSGSQVAQIGDILFARIVAVADLAVLDGCSPFAIPPQEKVAIIALRKRMQEAGGPVTAQTLDEWTEELLELYQDLAEPILNPRPPELRNTDDDPLVFHKLVFEVASASAAFDALFDLSVMQDWPSLLAEAKIGRDGALASVEIPWEKHGNELHKHWDNTVLGRLLIEGTKLTAEVNSERRAKTIRALIEQRLGDRVRYRTTSTESPQAMLARTRKNDARKKPGRTHEELVAIPEVREHLMQELRTHYEHWVDTPIPLLDGRTPREAVKNADGREAVAALVLQLERSGAKMTPPLDPAIVRDVRVALGLQGN